MLYLTQKGFAHIFALITLVIGLVAGLYLVTHPAIFKPKASAGDDLQIVDSSGKEFPNNTTDNPNVHLKINLPEGWVVGYPGQSFNFNLVKTAYAQESCKSDCGSCTTQNTCGYETYDTCTDDRGQAGNDLCSNGATKFGCQAGSNSNCQSGKLEYSCANSSQCSSKTVINARLNDLKTSVESDCKSDCGKCKTVNTCGYTTYDNCKDDQGYSGTDLCKHGASKFGCQALDNDNCQSGKLEYNCSNNPQCSDTGDISPQIKQTDKHIIQKIIIENKDTDGSSGGSEKKEIPLDQLNTLIPWELEHLQANQPSAQRYVQVTLFDGSEYKPLPAKITLTKPSGKGNGIQARISPGLEVERIDSMRSTFKISTDLPDNMVEQAVKDDLYKSNIVVDGDITNGDAVVSVLSDCINNQQTNYLFSEYDAFPPLCLTDEEKQKTIQIIKSGVESAADFVIPYSQAKQAVELASEIQNVRSFLKKAGIADRNQLSVISGPDSDFDGYAVTLIRIKELEKDVQENPDGSGKLTPAQEEARREYLADLRTLWEKQHNILFDLAGATALSVVIDKPLKVAGDIARPYVRYITSRIPKNPVSDFIMHTWNAVIKKVPENILKLQEEINSRAYKVYLKVIDIPRPKRSNAMDSVKLQEWINAHPEGIARDTARAIINETRHIGQQEFEEALTKSISEFKKGLNGEDYIAFVEPKKSNQWVTEIAMHDVDYLPAQVYNLANGSTREGLSNYTRFVFFDDAIYSGEQMFSNIKNVVAEAVLQGADPDKIVVDVVVPFTTEYGFTAISKALNDGLHVVNGRMTNINLRVSVNFHVIEQLPSITGALSKYDRDILSQAQYVAYRDGDSYFVRSDEDALLSTHNTDNKTLTYFDHKIPDIFSTIEDVYLKGEVRNAEGYVLDKHVIFIPETAPPYK